MRLSEPFRRISQTVCRRVFFCLVASVFVATADGATGFVRTPDGCELFVRVVGRGSETVVVPGGMFFAEALDSLGSGRKLVLYDMRNRGRSCFERRNDRLGLDQDVEDLDAIRRHFGLESFDLIGFSYLGKMVVLYALEHPDRGRRIVQIAPGAMDMSKDFESDPGVTDPAIDKEAVESLEKMRETNQHLTDPEEYCELKWMIDRRWLVSTPEGLSHLRPSNCEMPNEWPTNLARHYAHHFPTVQSSIVTAEDLQSFDRPVLTIHGRRDRNSPYAAGREWAASLPNARLITIDDAAHSLWADAPGIIDQIDRFLSGEWPESAEIVPRP